jgi:hypothetical protein
VRRREKKPYEGGDYMANYKLTVEVLEVRIAPVGFSLGGQ